MIKEIIDSVLPEPNAKLEISDAIQETHYEAKDVVDVDYEEIVENDKDDNRI